MDSESINSGTTGDIEIPDGPSRRGIGRRGVTVETQCDEPGCIRRCIGDKCAEHSTSVVDDRVGGFEPVTTPSLGSAPSRRELQRQLDRLEGKVDALLTALELEVDDDDD